MSQELTVVSFKGLEDSINKASDTKVWQYVVVEGLKWILLGLLVILGLSCLFCFIVWITNLIFTGTLSNVAGRAYDASFILLVAFLGLWLFGGMINCLVEAPRKSVCLKCRKNRPREDIPYCNVCLRKSFSEADSLFRGTMSKIEKMKRLGLEEQIKGAVKLFEKSFPEAVKIYLATILARDDLERVGLGGLKLKSFNPKGFNKRPLDTELDSINLPLGALNALENLLNIPPSVIDRLKTLIPGFEEIAIFEKIRDSDPVLAVKIKGGWFEISRWD